MSQFGLATSEDSDEDNPGDPVPIISSNGVLESLYKPRLHEEQQADGDQYLIHHLLRHEQVLLRRQVDKQHQTGIWGYFG